MTNNLQLTETQKKIIDFVSLHKRAEVAELAKLTTLNTNQVRVELHKLAALKQIKLAKETKKVRRMNLMASIKHIVVSLPDENLS